MNMVSPYNTDTSSIIDTNWILMIHITILCILWISLVPKEIYQLVLLYWYEYCLNVRSHYGPYNWKYFQPKFSYSEQGGTGSINFLFILFTFFSSVHILTPLIINQKKLYLSLIIAPLFIRILDSVLRVLINSTTVVFIRVCHW